MTYLLTLGILIIGFCNWHWGSNLQTLSGEIIAICWLSNEIRVRFSPVPAMAFLYFASYTVYCQYTPVTYHVLGYDAFQGVMFFQSSRSLVCLLLVVVPFIFIKKEHLPKILKAFQIIALIEIPVMVFTRYLVLPDNGWRQFAGIMMSDSIDGTFLSLMLPFFLFIKADDMSGPSVIDKHLAMIVILIGCILSKSSTVYGVLCIELLVFLLLKYKVTLKSLIFIFITGLCTIPIGFLFLGDQLLNGNGRPQILSLTWSAYKAVLTPIRVLFGLGSAAFISLMPPMQPGKELFIYLHSDPLQIIFEQGVIGGILILSLYLTMLYRNRSDVKMTMVLAGLGLQSCIQPTMRYFIFAVFMAFLVRLSFLGSFKS